MTQFFKEALKGFEKTCACCSKWFLCMNPADYTYVLVVDGKKQYYCCYTCWLKAKRQLRDDYLKRTGG